MAIVVSVVMSVFNGEKYLKESISSILTQSFTDFEFIIINDGSTDKSEEIIKSFCDERIVLINQENTGLAEALNNGIAIANSNIIVRMDADDISLPDRIKIQFDFLQKNKKCIAVGSNAIEINHDGAYIFTSKLLLSWPDIKESINRNLKDGKPWNPFYHSSVTFKKDAFYEAGAYNRQLIKSQDIVLFTKMSEIGELWNLESPLLKYRILPNATTSRKIRRIKFFRKILIAAIKDQQLTNQELSFLKRISSGANVRARKAGYHLYLGKKYLFNNYQPNLALSNLFKVLKYNPLEYMVYAYIILILLPNKIAFSIYNSILGHKQAS